jgi:aminoglycoside phosphotransferase (APT) family kinase protein
MTNAQSVGGSFAIVVRVAVNTPPGIEWTRIDWSNEERDANAVTLARFLSELHNLPIDSSDRASIPRDDHQRADGQKGVKRTEERLRKRSPELAEFDLEAIISTAYDCANAPRYDGPLRWLHGDLYPRHLLVDPNRKLCGVIDWGDVHIGDPAMDCSIAFTFLSPVGRSLFLQNYDRKEDAFWHRARYRAFHYGAALTDYGVAVGDSAMVTMGKYALRNAVRPDEIP